MGLCWISFWIWPSQETGLRLFCERAAVALAVFLSPQAKTGSLSRDGQMCSVAVVVRAAVAAAADDYDGEEGYFFLSLPAPYFQSRL